MSQFVRIIVLTAYKGKLVNVILDIAMISEINALIALNFVRLQALLDVWNVLRL